jgi:HEAT repeat protein
VKVAAARAVGKLGSVAATETILDRLAELLRISPYAGSYYGDSFQVSVGEVEAHWQVAAADAVGALGSAAATPAILDRLTRLLQHWVEGAQFAAAEAVGKLGPAAATEPILDLLAQHLHAESKLSAADSDWLRAESCRRAGRTRSAAAAAVGDLMGAGLRLFPRTPGTHSLSSSAGSGGWEVRMIADLSR